MIADSHARKSAEPNGLSGNGSRAMGNLDTSINCLRKLERRQLFYTRLFTMIGILALLVGCATDPVLLRHPQTGKTVQCGPYSTTTGLATMTALEHERGCIQDYQRQSYERVMK